MLEQSNKMLEESIQVVEKSDTSDSWANIVMGFLNNYKLSGKNQNDDHKNSLVIDHTKKSQISHEAPKKVVKKKIILKGQYPQLSLIKKSGGNKYTPEAVPDYGDWCDKRQKLHYGQKRS